MSEGMAGWDLYVWSWVLCTVAVAGLVGAFTLALGVATGKGILGFLSSDRAPTVVVVNGASGTFQLPPERKAKWGFARLFGLFAGLFSGVPMLVLLVMGILHALRSVFGSVGLWLEAANGWIVGHWWLALVATAVASLVGAAWWLARRPSPDVTALPAPVPTPVAAAPLWSAPPLEGNWARRADSTSE